MMSSKQNFDKVTCYLAKYKESHLFFIIIIFILVSKLKKLNTKVMHTIKLQKSVIFNSIYCGSINILGIEFHIFTINSCFVDI